MKATLRGLTREALETGGESPSGMRDEKTSRLPTTILLGVSWKKPAASSLCRLRDACSAVLRVTGRVSSTTASSARRGAAGLLKPAAGSLRSQARMTDTAKRAFVAMPAAAVRTANTIALRFPLHALSQRSMSRKVRKAIWA
ncbi:MAG: hypothetical protein BWY99_02799 [Synergistetes bacterium ADurb.BinA166]|nr:MAG: hypothetical protein BWY99_02799 [Synergistetes bacterium ADurb.BinA166]